MTLTRKQIVIVNVLILLLVALCVFFKLWQRSLNLAFDPVAWKQNGLKFLASKASASVYDAVRDRMIKDLLKKHQLAGMSAEAISELLGKPDSVRQEPFQDWDMIYWLGPDHRGLAGALDSLWLVVKTNSAGYVGEFRVMTD